MPASLSVGPSSQLIGVTEPILFVVGPARLELATRRL